MTGRIVERIGRLIEETASWAASRRSDLFERRAGGLPASLTPSERQFFSDWGRRHLPTEEPDEHATHPGFGGAA